MFLMNKTEGSLSGRSSPQARGCFLYILGETVAEVVFPAGAGVFLWSMRQGQRGDRLPRRRGGVSHTST